MLDCKNKIKHWNPSLLFALPVQSLAYKGIRKSDKEPLCFNVIVYIEVL